MPHDNKYGHVQIEHGSHIPDDEPGVWFRAKDVLTPAVLEHYLWLCHKAGSPQRHLDMVEKAIALIKNWQLTHLVKVPDSESSKAWLGH